MKHWNRIYQNPEEYTYYDLGTPHEDLSYIASSFNERGVSTILDLGCGSGRNLFFLHEKAFFLSGIDIAPEGIRTIRKRIPDADVRVGDIYEPLPYPDASFDAILSIQVLQHATEDKIVCAINEMERILRPGGFIFVTVCGRYANGKERYCLVRTARKVASHTYVPTIGEEKGLTHFIYTKRKLREHFSNFRTIEQWKDSRDYYCLLVQKPVP